jgi:hypothetical protein
MRQAFIHYHIAWKTMAEESGDEGSNSSKLLIDNPLDFQFHAAYLNYSDAYDQAADPEAKKQLNESISALHQNQIDYSTFYERIAKFRGEDISGRMYSRTPIKTQNKREWRRKTQKHERIERHKK